MQNCFLFNNPEASAFVESPINYLYLLIKMKKKSKIKFPL